MDDDLVALSGELEKKKKVATNFVRSNLLTCQKKKKGLPLRSHRDSLNEAFTTTAYVLEIRESHLFFILRYWSRVLG